METANGPTSSLVDVVRIPLPDTDATELLGCDVAMALRPGDVLALDGDLGAGKTTLARAAIRTLAGDPTLDVPSPTFTLVQTYAGEPPIAHFDLYRLAGDDDLVETGFAEAAEAGIVIVEWPRNAAEAVEAATIAVRLEPDPSGGRSARIAATPEAAARLERSLAIRQFLVAAEHGGDRRRRFTGDASARRYETIHRADDTTDAAEAESQPPILMDAPERPDGPPVHEGEPYSRVARLAETVTPFVAIARALDSAGFAAPTVRRADLDAGFVLLDHLGSGSLLDADGRPVAERYDAAVDCLADLHVTPFAHELPAAPNVTHRIPAFDRRAMAVETVLLPEWYLPRAKGRPASHDERALFCEIWDNLFDRLETVETGLVLRDVHSPNLIWRPHDTGRRRIGLIDFQDAVIGPLAYDLASLAQDARVTVDEALEMRLTTRYARLRRERDAGFDAFGFEQAYAIMAAQRATKILGLFVRLLERDAKPQYLRHIPRIKSYLIRTLGHPALGALASLYEDWGVFEPDARA